MSEESRQAYREVRAAEAALQAARQKTLAEAGQPWRTTMARAIRKPAWAQGNYFYVGVVQHITGTLQDCPHRHLSEKAADQCAKAMARSLNKPVSPC